MSVREDTFGTRISNCAGAHGVFVSDDDLPAVAPLEINPLVHTVIDKLCSRDGVWSLALLDPGNQSSERVPLRLKGDHGRRTSLAKHPRAGAAGAVVHARDAEEAQVRVQTPIGCDQALVEALRVGGPDLLVLLAVVGDDAAAAGLEGGQRLGERPDPAWVGRLGGFGVGEAVARRVPVRVGQDRVPKPLDRGGEGSAREEARRGEDLCAGVHPGPDQGAVGVGVRRVDGLDLGDLRPGEAGRAGLVGLVGPAEELRRVKVALVGDLDDAVGDAVEGVALREDLVVDQAAPGRDGDVVGRAGGAGHGEHARPQGVQVVKVHGWGAGQDAIVLFFVVGTCVRFIGWVRYGMVFGSGFCSRLLESALLR